MKEAKHRLLDADVCFAARDDDMCVSRHTVEKTVFPACIEELLVNEAILFDANCVGGCAQALRILYGEQARDTEQLRRLDETVRSLDGRRAFVNCRHQARLEVDDQQNGALGSDGQHGVSPLKDARYGL